MPIAGPDGDSGSGDLLWSRDADSWPNAAASRFLTAGGLRWHVQDLGSGPAILLVHGTGASAHSWAGMLPRLAERGFRPVAVDLPGHGFTDTGSHQQSSLPGMARVLAAVVDELALVPTLVVGHSAGAAILARMCIDGSIAPAGVVSLNGALLPLSGLAGQFFAPAAKVLAKLPLVPTLFAWGAGDRRRVERLVEETGSVLPVQEVAYYHRLVSSPKHVAAALRMMANWDLAAFARELPRLETPLHLVACENDRTVPPAEAQRVARHLPTARVRRIPGLGHLGHEEDPGLFADLIESIASDAGVG